MNTATRPMYEWQDLPWKKIEQAVFKLQKRIYQASQRGDTKAIHKLQRLLISSWSARCLAVRRVTQDNRGKNTAGVDGIKSLTPPERLRLAQTLRLSQTACPVRRVWIPKPGKVEKRPLGIPTIANRAEQALAKLALEPEWEARFEPNSYGFRPGRSAHDAIEAIFKNICLQAKYVLDADIAACFDKISHSAVLAKLQTYPAMQRAVRAWLRAGVLDGETLFPTTEGSPQGGRISPLIANIALHGLETAVAAAHPKAKVIRYADDLVVLHPELKVIEKAEQTVAHWLDSMGLELKPSKTYITHTLDHLEGKVGFDFLGFHIRQYPVGKTHSGKTSGRYPKLLGYKTLIKPSEKAIQRHYETICAIIDANPTTPQARLIGQLNPSIIGWTNYYATVVAKDVFGKLSHLTFVKLFRWAKRRHSTKSNKWIVRKYWRLETGSWIFAPKEGVPLRRHYETPIQRHIKVSGNKSPYDGDWVCWATRRGRQPGLPKRVATLLKWQAGKCAYCGLYFGAEDKSEVDHIISKARGGHDGYNNWQLLHAHCHHQKTVKDEKLKQLEALMTAANHARSRMRVASHVRF
ncbi:MAG: group II intron reverse transcriptase/maturase [Chloroflexi bacterium]|nr:group II intron reverse transcriptase/maturase [Chloroflexota bacterium]